MHKKGVGVGEYNVRRKKEHPTASAFEASAVGVFNNVVSIFHIKLDLMQKIEICTFAFLSHSTHIPITFLSHFQIFCIFAPD